MSAGARAEGPVVSGPAPARIEPGQKVADVLARFPATEPVFVQFGFAEVRNPVLRRTIARRVSLAGACSMHGRNAEAFVSALNAAALGSR